MMLLLPQGCKSLSAITQDIKHDSQPTVSEGKKSSDSHSIISSFDLESKDINASCPDVVLVKDLSEMHQFRDTNNTLESEKIASIFLRNIAHQCVVENGKLSVQIAMGFEAHLGPRSRIFNQDEPTISYPYFLAITDTNGEILDKEIHGVSLSFNSDQSHKKHKEHISKILNISSLKGDPPYTIMVGFQLSPEELRYNQIIRGKLLAPEAGKKPKYFVTQQPEIKYNSNDLEVSDDKS